MPQGLLFSLFLRATSGTATSLGQFLMPGVELLDLTLRDANNKIPSVHIPTQGNTQVKQPGVLATRATYNQLMILTSFK